MADILEELSWRGLLNQSTDLASLRNWLSSPPRRLYAGFDPTADSLHVGHLMAVVLLRRFQQAGHAPIVLVGGATGMIGDPSGKSEERNLLSREILAENVQAIRRQLTRFLDFQSATNPAIVVNNLDWIGEFSYVDFLRDIGKNFPVNVMLAKDSVKARIERTDAGISYTEFSYMLLQAYDFVHLFRKYGCGLQIGGSDQWGNITAGIDLARRMDQATLHGMTCPLLTKSDGTKMGKSERGAVWLCPTRTSPFHFYQYWVNVEDADAGKCLRFFTDLSREEIEALDQSRAEQPQMRESQKKLAQCLTHLVHGEEGLSRALRATEILFGAEIAQVNDADLSEIFADVPSKELPRIRLASPGLNVVDALVETGLAKSKSDARRSLASGGIYVNNRRVASPEKTLQEEDLASETVIVLRSGKKSYALLRFSR